MDFDLSRLDEIPDVIPAQDAAAKVPPPPPLTGQTESPARAAIQRRRALALLGSVAWLVAQVVVLGLRTDFARLGTSYALTQVAVPAVAGAAALGLAVWPGRDGFGAAAGTLRAVIVVALGAVAAVALLVPLPFPYAPPAGSMAPVQWILVCADIVLVMGALPLAVAAAAWRRSFAVAAAERTGALGAACGIGAVTSMHLHCENILPGHVLFGHVVPALALALAGAFVLHRFTRA